MVRTRAAVGMMVVVDSSASGLAILAWLDEADWSLKPLSQIYRRVTNDRFEYASPANGFTATLLLDEAGLVRDYPGLWTAIDRQGEFVGGISG